MIGRIMAAVVVLSGLAHPSLAQQQRPRTVALAVENSSDDMLQFLFVTGTDEIGWGEDRLGSDTLSPRARQTFEISTARRCRFDIKAVYASGATALRGNVDICQRPRVALSPGDPDAALIGRQGPVAFFVARNRTGVVMQTLILTTGSSRSDDLLGVTTVPAGASFIGRISRERCRAGITATFQGLDDQRVAVRDLCGARVDVGTGTPPAPAATGPEVSLTVVNRNTIPLQVIHARPVGVTGWGEDRLGSQVVGARASLTLQFRRGTECRHDIRATFDGGHQEERAGVDLCAPQTLAFDGPALARGRGQAKASADKPTALAVTRVSVVNQGTSPIEGLYASSSRVSDWGEERLSGRTIAPNGRETFDIERDDQCNFDIRAVFAGGREETRMRQNICARSEIAFGGATDRRIDGGGPEAGRRVTFANDGRASVRELYLTPVSDTHWGDDRLGSEVMPRRFRFELRLPSEGGCQWDIRIVYDNGRSVERRDQNLCRDGEINIALPGRGGSVVSTGTGFYISGNGHIVTNHHVIDGCTSVAIAGPDRQRIPVRVVGSDEGMDLALLVREGATTPALRLRRASSALTPGERVVLVGYPARSQLGGVNVTEGIVSALRGAMGDVAMFQYSAPTQPGNSGGPVFDGSGLVLGVVVSQIDKLSGERTAQNINFGIRGDVLRQFLGRHGVTPEDADATSAEPAPAIFRAVDPSVVPLDCLD